MSLLAYSLPWPACLGPRPERLKAETPTAAVKPMFTLEGIAFDATSAKLRNSRERTTFARIGERELCLTSEHEPGWPAALRMYPGRHYKADVYECESRAKKATELPLDANTAEGLVFYSLCRELGQRKDEADARRVMRDCCGIWTDGLMVRSAGLDNPNRLTPGRVYKVIVREVTAS